LRAPRPSHPVPNVRDDREPPLSEGTGRAQDKRDLGFWKSELFSRGGLEQMQPIEGAGEISFFAHAVLVIIPGQPEQRSAM
jgi:hypothetical protein